MSNQILEKYLPENSLAYVKKWAEGHKLHIKISRDRSSKLGDYQKQRDGSHDISINHSLSPELFFFVLTHELAHLIAFETYKPQRISAHGKEWKHSFREMLYESLSVYSVELQPLIIKFSKSPKANFMVSGDLVKYFHPPDIDDNEVFVESLSAKNKFIFRGQMYQLEEKLKKNYLCENLVNGKKYVFKALAKVEKIQS